MREDLARTDSAIEEAVEHDEENSESFSGPWYKFPPIRNALLSGILLLVAWLVQRNDGSEVLFYIVLGLAIVIGGYYWVPEGVQEFVEEREVGIEALMFFATIGALILQEYFEAAFLVFLFAAAEGIEEFT